MSNVRHLDKAIHTLPPVAHKELADLVDYLRHKHCLDRPEPFVKLGGLWAGIDFEVTDEDVRSLRQQVSRHLAHGV